MDALDPLFPHLVRVARTLLGWSQRELAEWSDLSVTFISRLERGERLGRVEKLVQLRDALVQAGIDFEHQEEQLTIRLKGGFLPALQKDWRR